MNYYRCANRGLFTVTYCYVDCVDYELDKIAAKYKRPLVSVFKEMSNNDSPDLLLIFAKIFKKDVKFFEGKIFPETDRNLSIKYGQRYKNVCKQLEKIVMIAGKHELNSEE